VSSPERISGEAGLLAFMERGGVAYRRFTHPPVYTCDEARRYRPPFPGLETKNLFLRDEKRRFFLVMTDCVRRLDLRGLGRAIGAPKLHFGSQEDLLERLGLEPGAVTVLGLVNDFKRQVELLVDAQYWPSPAYLCHPLVNTATLALDHAALLQFLALTGHAPRVVEMPG
jgi:Ala-tRNA(Pro) deacylase